MGHASYGGAGGRNARDPPGEYNHSPSLNRLFCDSCIYFCVLYFCNCMPATADSSLSGRYFFADCTVISVEGSTHSVSSQFLEDVSEKMEHRTSSFGLSCT